ncbi:MAG: Do family serine endopeptidase [Gammaproteobacteria bacterium]|nr:Do family serine endopeptidase [Gammaproteobacteria bacterium]
MRRNTTITSLFLFLFLGVSALGHAALPLVDSQGKPLPTLAPMLERTMPAVVNIATSGHVRVQESPLFSDPFFRRFFNLPDQQQPREQRTQALGSGVIVDAEKGYILTNNHVIDKADAITVTLKDGRSFKAKLIGTDPETDIAVVQIKATGLTAVKIGNSDKIRVGDFAVAIGNPFGLGQTVTSGIISALGRSGLGIEGYEDFIQTDASINPGNSGGALVDLDGDLIGINTAIFSQSGGNIGIGFAIPINMAHEIMTQLIAHGEVKRGQLGAQAQDLTPDLVQAFNLPNGRAGAVITKVTPKSAADKAGLKAGDIVIDVNGRPVRDASDLRNYIGVLRVGEKVSLQILRDGKRDTLNAVVEEPKMSQMPGKTINPQLEGATFSDIDPGNPLYGQIEGVLVAEVDAGSPAWRAGLRKGDVIVSANRRTIKSLADLEGAVKGSSALLLNIQRGGMALFLYLQ